MLPKKLVILLFVLTILSATSYKLSIAAPTGNPPTGGGAIKVNSSAPSGSITIDSGGRVGIGIAPTQILTVAGTIRSTTGGFMFPDNTTQTTSFGSSSSLSAGNVSAGSFGSNAGGGNYSFPANVGIGTTSPLAKLHVALAGPQLLLSRSNGGYGLQIEANSNIYFRTKLVDDSTWQTFIQTCEGCTSSNAHLILQPTAGNVGIGTTSPNVALQVNATTGNVARFVNTTNTANNDAAIFLDSSRSAAGSPLNQCQGISAGFSATQNDQAGQMSLLVRSGGSCGEIGLTVRGQPSNASPNVGIGTTSPSTSLHVVGANGDLTATLGQLYLTTNNSQAAGNGGSINFGGVYTGSTITNFAGIAGRKENGTAGNFAGYLQFSTRANGVNDAERMRIDSNGNVGIGTTAPISRLHVIGSSTVTSGSGTVSRSLTDSLNITGVGTSFGSAGNIQIGDTMVVGTEERVVVRIASTISLFTDTAFSSFTGQPFSYKRPVGRFADSASTDHIIFDSKGGLKIRGSGTTGTTNSLYVTDSSGAPALIVDNNRGIRINEPTQRFNDDGTGYQFYVTGKTRINGDLEVNSCTGCGGGGGGVTSVSVVSANGFNGSVANSSTTPAITISTTINGLLKGNGTAISAATAGTDYQTPLTFFPPLLNTSGTISIPAATSAANGYLSSVNWATFNSKAQTGACPAGQYMHTTSFDAAPTCSTPTVASINASNVTPGEFNSTAGSGGDYVFPAGLKIGDTTTGCSSTSRGMMKFQQGDPDRLYICMKDDGNPSTNYNWVLVALGE